MASGYAGVTIGTAELNETGPNTGIFTGSTVTINEGHLTHDASGLNNQFVQAICSRGCGGSVFTQANLIHPPEPEPVPEPEPQAQSSSSSYATVSGPFMCPRISNHIVSETDNHVPSFEYFNCYYDNGEYGYPEGRIEIKYLIDSVGVPSGWCTGDLVDDSNINSAGGYTSAYLTSSTHQIHVVVSFGSYDHDESIAAARQMLSQMEQNNSADSCSSSGSSSTTQSDPEPTYDDTSCPAGSVYVEKYGACVITQTPSEPTTTESEDTTREQQAMDDAKRIEEFNQMMAQKAQQEKMDQLDEYISKGDQAYDAGNYDQAILFYNKANQIISSNEITEKIRDSEDKLINKATNQDLKDSLNNKGIPLAESKVREAEEQTGKDNPSEAIRLYREALEATPTDEVEERGFISLALHNAQIDLADKIKSESPRVKPIIYEKYQLLDKKSPAVVNVPTPLPTVGKGSHDRVEIIRKTLGDSVDVQNVEGTSTLNVGDVILVHEDAPPYVIDWGHATTTIQPGSTFLIGTPEQLRSFASGKPHYVEVVEGTINLYNMWNENNPKDFEFESDPERETCRFVKTGINLNQVCGTDVTFTHDKDTGESSIQVDHGTVQVYDETIDDIKEYGVGTTLETNNDGYYVESAYAQEDSVEIPSSGGGCLIATATYGTELAPQVQQLRELRDNTLLQTDSGTSFMTGFNQIYYSFSPGIADLERENPVFKEVVKLTITPMITSLSLLNYVEINSDVEMLGFGISLIVLNVGMYCIAPAILVITIKKKI